jgi:hypothetical protein
MGTCAAIPFAAPVETDAELATAMALPSILVL